MSNILPIYYLSLYKIPKFTIWLALQSHNILVVQMEVYKPLFGSIDESADLLYDSIWKTWYDYEMVGYFVGFFSKLNDSQL